MDREEDYDDNNNDFNLFTYMLRKCCIIYDLDKSLKDIERDSNIINNFIDGFQESDFLKRNDLTDIKNIEDPIMSNNLELKEERKKPSNLKNFQRLKKEGTLVEQIIEIAREASEVKEAPSSSMCIIYTFVFQKLFDAYDDGSIEREMIKSLIRKQIQKCIRSTIPILFAIDNDEEAHLMGCKSSGRFFDSYGTPSYFHSFISKLNFCLQKNPGDEFFQQAYRGMQFQDGTSSTCGKWSMAWMFDLTGTFEYTPERYNLQPLEIGWQDINFIWNESAARKIWFTRLHKNNPKTLNNDLVVISSYKRFINKI